MSTKKREEFEGKRSENRNKERFSEKDREKFLRLSTADREFKLPDEIPNASENCKHAWVLSRYIEKFQTAGWQFIENAEGEKQSKEFFSSIQGKEVHYAMEIPMEWYLQKEQINQEKQKKRKQLINQGIDGDAPTVGDKEGQFFVVDGHKVHKD